MSARIYQPSRNAMQSGQGKTKRWVLEFSQSEVRNIDPLMGWTGSGDTNSQVKLFFETKDEAIDEKINFTFNKAQQREVTYAMSNTFGFGGHNACVLFKKFED